MHSLLAYFCQSDIQCNNKGICQNGTCECQPGWEKNLDCTGIKIKMFYDLVLEVGIYSKPRLYHISNKIWIEKVLVF